MSPTASRSQDHFGHENWDHQLKLAVAWNRVDIARSEIFTDEWQWKVGCRVQMGCVCVSAGFQFCFGTLTRVGSILQDRYPTSLS